MHKLIAIIVTWVLFGAAAVAQTAQIQQFNPRIEVTCPRADDVVFEFHTEDREYIARAGAGWIRYPSPGSSNMQYWPDDLDPDDWKMMINQLPNGDAAPVVASPTRVAGMRIQSDNNRLICSYDGALGGSLSAPLRNCEPNGPFRQTPGSNEFHCTRIATNVSDVVEQCSATCDRPVGAVFRGQ